MSQTLQQLEAMRLHFSSGSMRSYETRRQHLLRLKQSVLAHEQQIHDALYQDLKKNPEESWVTEIGFLLSEINHTLKHLKQWMKREKVSTNLLNFPSRSYIYKEPLGVVLIIGPWNYPFQLLLTPLVGALAAGNCAVLKPSEFAPATAAVMRKIIAACFPPEEVLYVEGNGAEVIPQMMQHFRFDHVFYTGSTGVGKLIYGMASAQLVPVTLELGGKSPCVVSEDANIRIAAKRIALPKFSNAGQMCVAPDYVLVHRSRKEELVQELINNINAFFTPDASDSYDYGKIINERQFNRLVGYLEQGHVLYGGQYNADTHFMAPTLLDNISPEMAVMGEEIFGPLLPILAYDRFEEAVSIINRNSNPLAFYLFTEDSSTEKKWLEAVPFGGGCINNASWHLTNFNLPFGGRGNSGIGAYHGKYSFEVFSHRKAVMKTPTWFDPSIKYPPFKGKLNLFKKMIR